MPIVRFKCPKCQRIFSFPDVITGKAYRCQKCRTRFVAKTIGNKTILQLAGVSGDATTRVTPMPIESVAAELEALPADPSPRKHKEAEEKPNRSWMTPCFIGVTAFVVVSTVGLGGVIYAVKRIREAAEQQRLEKQTVQPNASPSVPFPTLRHETRKTPEKAIRQKESLPVDWNATSDRIESGDVLISLPIAIVGNVYPHAGLGINTRVKRMAVLLRIENKSTTKVVRWEGWLGEGKATDENGNECLPAPPQWQLDPLANFTNGDLKRHWQDLPDDENPRLKRKRLELFSWEGDRGCRVNPGKVYITYLYFEAPPPIAKEVRLEMTLPPSKNLLRFRVPLKHLE